MKCVLAIDQGTTGSTALVVAQDGTVLGRAYREFTQHFPKPGWVEHDPEEIWTVTREVATTAVDESGENISAIGITNQRETVVVWDRLTGRPLHNAIVWQDRRTAERCRQLSSELGSEFLRRRTGLTWDPYFSATKLEWLKQNDRGFAAKLDGGDVAVGTIDSWLIHKLSGGESHVTEHTNASRTMLYGLDQRDWDEEMLNVFGLPRNCLPEVLPSSGEMATATSDIFGYEVPVTGAAGDQQAALFGQGCWEAGMAKCTYGTGAFLLFPIGGEEGTRAGAGMLTTIGCRSDGSPVLTVEGSIFIAGAAVQWLRDGLGLLESAGETEALARSIENTGGVYFVPALVGLGAPHWESEARGAILGLTRGTGRAHIARAALEAMAYSTRELVESIEGPPLKELRVDGGAAANDWLMQFQADTLQVPVARPDMVETTALGAAGLAGLAAGVWRSAEEFVEARKYTVFEPGKAEESEFQGWKRAVDAVLHHARTAIDRNLD